MTKAVRLAIVGVGNCASSLLQGIDYYRDHATGRTVGTERPRRRRSSNSAP